MPMPLHCGGFGVDGCLGVHPRGCLDGFEMPECVVLRLVSAAGPWGLVVVDSLTESLILAQDERWRRA